MFTRIGNKSRVKRFTEVPIGHFFVQEHDFEVIYQKCNVISKIRESLDKVVAINFGNGTSHHIFDPDMLVIECKLVEVDDEGLAVFELVE